MLPRLAGLIFVLLLGCSSEPPKPVEEVAKKVDDIGQDLDELARELEEYAKRRKPRPAGPSRPSPSEPSK